MPATSMNRQTSFTFKKTSLLTAAAKSTRVPFWNSVASHLRLDEVRNRFRPINRSIRGWRVRVNQPAAALVLIVSLGLALWWGALPALAVAGMVESASTPPQPDGPVEPIITEIRQLQADLERAQAQLSSFVTSGGVTSADGAVWLATAAQQFNDVLSAVLPAWVVQQFPLFTLHHSLFTAVLLVISLAAVGFLMTAGRAQQQPSVSQQVDAMIAQATRVSSSRFQVPSVGGTDQLPTVEGAGITKALVEKIRVQLHDGWKLEDVINWIIPDDEKKSSEVLEAFERAVNSLGENVKTAVLKLDTSKFVNGEFHLQLEQRDTAKVIVQKMFAQLKTAGGKSLAEVFAGYVWWLISKAQGVTDPVILQTRMLEVLHDKRDAREAGLILSQLGLHVGLILTDPETNAPAGYWFDQHEVDPAAGSITGALRSTPVEHPDEIYRHADMIFATFDKFIHRYEQELLATTLSDQAMKFRGAVRVISDEADAKYNDVLNPNVISGDRVADWEARLKRGLAAETLAQQLMTAQRNGDFVYREDASRKQVALTAWRGQTRVRHAQTSATFAEVETALVAHLIRQPHMDYVIWTGYEEQQTLAAQHAELRNIHGDRLAQIVEWVEQVLPAFTFNNGSGAKTADELVIELRQFLMDDPQHNATLKQRWLAGTQFDAQSEGDDAWKAALVIAFGQVVIIDEFTKQLDLGRRWGDGLHEAVEIKHFGTAHPRTKVLMSMVLRDFLRAPMVQEHAGGASATYWAEIMRRFYNKRVVDVNSDRWKAEVKAVKAGQRLIQVNPGEAASLEQQLHEERANGGVSFARIEQMDVTSAADIRTVVNAAQQQQTIVIVTNRAGFTLNGGLSLDEQLALAYAAATGQMLVRPRVLEYAPQFYASQTHQLTPEDAQRAADYPLLRLGEDMGQWQRVAELAHEAVARPDVSLLVYVESDGLAEELKKFLLKTGIPPTLTFDKVEEDRIALLTATHYGQLEEAVKEAGHAGKITIVTDIATRGVNIRLKVDEQIGRASCRERVCQYV